MTALFLVINATLMQIPVGALPYTYIHPLEGCANFSAYLDPLAPAGIASVYVVSVDGSLREPGLDRYPTPKYVSGRACGAFLAIRLDSWRSLGPLVPVSVLDSATVNIYSEYDVNGTALLQIKSFIRPSVKGQFVFRVNSSQVYGVYLEEYVVYGGAVVSAYGVANLTYISVGGDKADYYLLLDMPGAKVEGVRPWVPEIPLRFWPNQTAVVGRPRVSQYPIQVPVAGQCNGTASVLTPLERPVRVQVSISGGEQYVVQLSYVPSLIRTWSVANVSATTVDGEPLEVLGIYSDDGQAVGRCIVEGLQYHAYVRAGNLTFRYPVSFEGGLVSVSTDLVIPRVSVKPEWISASVEPPAARAGSNVTVTLYVNGTPVARLVKRAEQHMQVDASALLRRVEVVDLLGEPMPSFSIHVGPLKFYGNGGTAYILPLSSDAVVEVNGVKYLVEVGEVMRVPTLSPPSALRIAVAAAIAGAAAGLGLARGGRPKKAEDETAVV